MDFLCVKMIYNIFVNAPSEGLSIFTVNSVLTLCYDL